jgi:uncharacterized pyridoxamine 5'-phosphate oxidase family protein
MNQNSWITPGIVTSFKHKRELYKELQNNNNATLASYYRDYSKTLSIVIRRAKRIEFDKLILNCYVFKDPSFLRVFQPNFCMYFSALSYYSA